MLYDKALEGDPENAEFWFGKMFALDYAGRTSEAIQTLSIVESKGLNDPLINSWAANVALDDGRIDEARSYLERMFDSEDSDPIVCTNLAECLLKLGSYDEAENVMNRINTALVTVYEKVPIGALMLLIKFLKDSGF